MNTKALIKISLDERMANLIEALFAFWSNQPKPSKRKAIAADYFYEKMTMFGLVPDLKFIENITSIVYQNRPKITQHITPTTAAQK